MASPCKRGGLAPFVLGLLCGGIGCAGESLDGLSDASLPDAVSDAGDPDGVTDNDGAADAGAADRGEPLILIESGGFIGTRDLLLTEGGAAMVYDFVKKGEQTHRLVFADLEGSKELLSGFESPPSSVRILPRAGGFTVWYRMLGLSSPVRALRVDSKGNRVGEVAELAMLQQRSDDRGGLAVVKNAKGYALLTRSENGPEIRLDLLAEDLAPLGSKVLLGPENTGAYNGQLGWLAESGSSVVVWSHNGVAYGGLFSSAGEPQGETVRICADVKCPTSTQIAPRVQPAGQGRALVRYWSQVSQMLLLVRVDPLAGTITAIWEEAVLPLPLNRGGESVDLSLSMSPNDLHIAWQSNACYPLPQIYLAKFSLGSTPPETVSCKKGAALLSDPSFFHERPVVRANDKGSAVLFSGHTKEGMDLLLYLDPGLRPAP